MYYNFAATSTAVYGNVTVDKIEPGGDFKALEINSGSNYRMTTLDDEFGQIEFWNKVEETLSSGDGSRIRNLFTVTTLSLAAILHTNWSVVF